MTFERTDVIGVGLAVTAIAMVAGLSLESWAITRCDEFMASFEYSASATYTPEQQACLDERLPRP